MSDSETVRLKADPPVRYVILLSFYVLLALVLGALTNHTVNYIGNIVGFGFLIKVILQILLVGVVVLFIKNLSKYVRHEPQENFSYDIMFVSVYMSSQENLQELLQKYK